MKTFKVIYFASYTFANFECTADTKEEAIRRWREFNDMNGYSIDRREVKSAKFDGKEI